jgi:hypothetical protein
MIVLPWHDQYWTEGEDRCTFSPNPVPGSEIASIARQLLDQEENPAVRRTLLSPLASSDQLTVQGLALELLVELESCVSKIRKDDLMGALCSLALAYECLIDATLEAQKLIPEDEKTGIRRRD